MNICGIELKSNYIIFCVVTIDGTSIEYNDTKIKKMILEEDELQKSIFKFKENLEIFLSDNQIDTIIIKKRAKKGNFAGGVITFKIESILQLNENIAVEFISPQAITKFLKNNSIEFPEKLHKYQEQAYLSALAF